jgi:oxygen-independent coproporphyrinogen-3 oxidase
MNAIERGVLNFESEELTTKDRYNEFVMTSLRTQWGVSYQNLESEFGTPYLNYFKMMITPFLHDALLFEEEGVVRATRKGKFLIDGIASELFMVELTTNRT